MPVPTMSVFFKDGKISNEYTKAYSLAGFKSGPVRSRGPFVMYLLSEKGLPYSKVREWVEGTLVDPSKEQMQEYFEDFHKSLVNNQIFDLNENKDKVARPDAGKKATVFGKWVADSVGKIVAEKLPSKDFIKKPEDAFEYLNSFPELSFYVKDIVQEYPDLWKNPATSGYVVDAMGEENMMMFSKVELLANVLGTFKDFVNQGDKFKALIYPKLMEFIDYTQGKSISELENNVLANMYFDVFGIYTNMPNMVGDKEKNDKKYTDFLKGENADLDINDIKYKSVYSDKEVNLREGISEVKQTKIDSGSDIYRTENTDFSKGQSEEKIKGLLEAIPDGFEYSKDVSQDVKDAVHELYVNTACNLYSYYSCIASNEMGKKVTDRIMVDGKPLSSIVKDKFKDADLTDEQLKTAMEFEFASVLTDKSKKVEYIPYKFNFEKGNIEQVAEPIKITQYDKPINRTYNYSVDILMNPQKEEKYGKNLLDILKSADDIYHTLYNDSNRLTDSSEFKRMLGSFKEMHELYQSFNDMVLEGGQIKEDDFKMLETTHGYTKDMVSALIKETAKNSADYINAKNAAGKYRTSDKGNDRLLCAAGFLNDLDTGLTNKNFADIKLKDAQGEKTVRENKVVKENDKRKKVSFDDIMNEGEEKRKNVVKKADNAARSQKKRMHERVAGNGISK